MPDSPTPAPGTPPGTDTSKPAAEPPPPAAASKINKHGFWKFKWYSEDEWFKFLIVLILILAGLYTGLHAIIDCKAGYEFLTVDQKQVQQINRIYFDSTSPINKPPVSAPVPDSLLKDTGFKALAARFNKVNSAKIGAAILNRKDSCVGCNGISHADRVIEYLKNEFDFKIDSVQLDSLHRYLNCCSPLEAIGFISNVRLKAKTFFWLTGPMIYFEIMFWTWFGVLASLLFNLGVVGKNSTTDPNNPSSTFDSSEIPSQVAKLLYGPACVLVVVLGYNFFSSQNLVDISSSKGVVVFAFIGGFYTSRLIAFLDRLKDVLLPNSGLAGLPESKQMPLRNLVVKIGLDAAVPAAVMTSIMPGDLSTAVVTLQPAGNDQGITAVNINKDQPPLFIFDNVKPGKYVVNASWSKQVGDQKITLNAKQLNLDMGTADMTVTINLLAS